MRGNELASALYRNTEPILKEVADLEACGSKGHWRESLRTGRLAEIELQRSALASACVCVVCFTDLERAAVRRLRTLKRPTILARSAVGPKHATLQRGTEGVGA